MLHDKIIYTGWYQINPMDGSVWDGIKPGVQAVQGALPAARAQRVGEDAGDGLHHVLLSGVRAAMLPNGTRVLTLSSWRTTRL